MPAEDLPWLERARAGDRQAFAELVRHCWPRVHRWLYLRTHDAQLAEDLAQETFLKAWRSLAALQHCEAFVPWLFRIAQHCFADRQRSTQARLLRQLPPEEPDPAPGPLEALVDGERDAAMREACARLPDAFRAAFLLWLQEDLTFAEIGQALDLKEETARWRVWKARLLLVRQLERYLDGKSP